MGNEPYYIDDPFEGDAPDLSTDGIEHLWIIEEAQKICRRPKNPFQKMAEKRKWMNIDSKYGKALIGKPWIENCFEWAREKNRERLAIIMPSLASLILNMARMTDWNQKQAEEEGIAVDDDRDLAEDGF